MLLLRNPDAFHTITLFDQVNNILTPDYFSKYGMFSIQVGLRGMGDKKLTSIRIRSSICH
jgi:hypothetical protein